MAYEKELYEMKKASIIAGKKIMDIYRKDFDVSYKEDHSPVTSADLAADEVILNKLKEAFPEYAFLSEETEDNLLRLDNDYCFIIDPLDGTKQFVDKTGEFTVNIALAYKQEIVVGVIYVPVLEELYFAVKGQGAFKVKERNQVQLFVSSRKEKLNVVKSRAHSTIKQNELYEAHKDKIKNVFSVGSSFKGCLIASGVIDAFYRFGMGTKEYDIAAMSIIVTEAGGVIKQLDHTKFIFNKEDIHNCKGYYILNDENNRFDYSK